nr:hypothetical protein [Tanacetum cinerariifolium]
PHNHKQFAGWNTTIQREKRDHSGDDYDDDELDSAMSPVHMRKKPRLRACKDAFPILDVAHGKHKAISTSDDGHERE